MRADRLLRGVLRERFVVTLATGETFDGLLDEHDTAYLTFVDAHALVSGQPAVPVDGALYLPRSNIAYMQRIPA